MSVLIYVRTMCIARTMCMSVLCVCPYYAFVRTMLYVRTMYATY